MKMLPKGKYVLFQAFNDDDKLIYGILERDEYGLEKMSNRDSLYTHIAVGDDKEPLKRILEELNLLRDELERADECIETLQDDKRKMMRQYSNDIRSMVR
tara:strand:- start:94 stop:393 length:300 start_codon:yes stop_codon:yes gene_type:complete